MHRRTLLAALPAFVATPLLAGGHGRLGTWSGVGNYSAGGTVEIADGQVRLLADFAFSGAPDPKIALGRSGYDANTVMGSLQSDTGASSYSLPAGVDHTAYNEVWIRCQRFNVPLAVARLA